MNEGLIKAFQMLSNDILRLFRAVLESDVGINRKPMANGRNTLKNSRLYNTANIEFDIPFIKLLVNDYIDDIENGRKRRASLVPMSDLIQWARRKGIPSDNHTMTIIQYAIWRDGIEGRPVMKTFWKLLDKELNVKYADILFEGIFDNLIKYFND